VYHFLVNNIVVKETAISLTTLRKNKVATLKTAIVAKETSISLATMIIMSDSDRKFIVEVSPK
jgi:hypothetical protein